MWLWDSCFHARAMSLVNDTLAWDYVKAVLAAQSNATGAVAIERRPDRTSAAVSETQPPLLAWAVWDTHAQGVARGADNATLRARLAYAAPRLARYLAWDLRNRAALAPEQAGMGPAPPVDVSRSTFHTLGAQSGGAQTRTGTLSSLDQTSAPL